MVNHLVEDDCHLEKVNNFLKLCQFHVTHKIEKKSSDNFENLEANPYFIPSNDTALTNNSK